MSSGETCFNRLTGVLINDDGCEKADGRNSNVLTFICAASDFSLMPDA